MDDPRMLDVLIIDDEEFVGRALARLLRAQGWLVEYVQQAADAAPLIRSRMPRLIVVDVMMPGAGGALFTASLRASHTGDARVLLYSGLESKRLELIAKDCGASAFVSKSDPSDALIDHVRALLA